MRALTLILAITLFSAGALAQGHGTTPQFSPPQQYRYDRKENTAMMNPDYILYFASHLYPASYSGDIWTGTVTKVRGRKIALAWTNEKGKAESFTGEVASSYNVPTVTGSETQTIFVDPPPQTLVGQKVMAYYVPEKKKVEAGSKTKKVPVNYILKLEAQ